MAAFFTNVPSVHLAVRVSKHRATPEFEIPRLGLEQFAFGALLPFETPLCPPATRCFIVRNLGGDPSLKIEAFHVFIGIVPLESIVIAAFTSLLFVQGDDPVDSWLSFRFRRVS